APRPYDEAGGPTARAGTRGPAQALPRCLTPHETAGAGNERDSGCQTPTAGRHSSAAGPLRTALVEEGLDADVEVAAAVALAHQVVVARQALDGEAADRFLGGPDGQGRVAGQAPAQRRRRGVEGL